MISCSCKKYICVCCPCTFDCFYNNQGFSFGLSFAWILFYVVLALVRPVINCFFMLSILRCICCQFHPDFRGQYSRVFVRTVSVIIHVIGRNLKSILFSRSEQYNWCPRSTSTWFILQNSANIFVRVVFYVILAFVGSIVVFRFFKLSNLRVGCYSCFLYFWQTGISKIFFKFVSSEPSARGFHPIRILL